MRPILAKRPAPGEKERRVLQSRKRAVADLLFEASARHTLSFSWAGFETHSIFTKTAVYGNCGGTLSRYVGFLL